MHRMILIWIYLSSLHSLHLLCVFRSAKCSCFHRLNRELSRIHRLLVFNPVYYSKHPRKRPSTFLRTSETKGALISPHGKCYNACVLPDIQLNDIVRLRKPHPCGSYEWKIVRLGADIGLECQTCKHRVLLPRRALARQLKSISVRAEDDTRANTT